MKPPCIIFDPFDDTDYKGRDEGVPFRLKVKTFRWGKRWKSRIGCYSCVSRNRAMSRRGLMHREFDIYVRQPIFP